MKLEPKELRDIYFNTLTAYFAPFILEDIAFDYSDAEFRLLTLGEFFDSRGYLAKDTALMKILKNLYLIAENKGSHTYNFFQLINLGEPVYASSKYFIFKINTIIYNSAIFRDLKLVLSLRTVLMSEENKRKVMRYWERQGKVEILSRLLDELYPQEYTYRGLAKKFGVPYELIKSLNGLTEAIKYETDSLEGVLNQLNIKIEKESLL